MIALALAFGASLAWGSADFVAGASCRRLALLSVLLVSQAAGLFLLVPVMLLVGGAPPSASFLLLGALAGILNAAALAALYSGLARGPIMIVAPIAAMDAVIPVVWGLVNGERPSAIVTVGMVLALVGVVFAARPSADPDHEGHTRKTNAKTVVLAVIAAICFGFFMVAMKGASEGGTLWAVTSIRFTTVVLLGTAALIKRQKLALEGRDVIPLLATGGLDVGASALFAAAMATGMLSIVGVLGSFYPVVTIVLAGIVLRERTAPMQRAGALGAIAGVALIAVR